MVILEISKLPRRFLQVRPLAYSTAVRDIMRTVPGLLPWDGHSYKAPAEALEPALRVIEQAGIALLRGDGFASFSVDPAAGAELPETLYAYQREGIQRLQRDLGELGAAFLADDMGLGKTAQTLFALGPALDQRTLVVGPAVGVGHWKTQAKLWLGIEAQRLERADSSWQGGWRLTSPGALREMKGWVLPAQRLIVDEIHYYAHDGAGRTKALEDYVTACREAHGTRFQIVALSGTPFETRVRDLYRPLDLLYPGRFGRRWDFEKRYCDGHFEEVPGAGRFWVANGSSNLPELHARLGSLLIRRTKAEVALSLPPRVRTVIPVPVPAAARKRMGRAFASLESDDLGPQLGRVEEYKVQAAVELAQDLVAQGHRPLLLVREKETGRELARKLGSFSYADGETPADKRKSVLDFGVDGGVATIYSVTTSIDLVDFDAIIYVGLDWRPSVMLQSGARLHRLGQRRTVLEYYLIGEHTLDEIIRAKVIERLDTFATVLGDAPEEIALRGTLAASEEELLAGILETVKERFVS